MQRPWGRSAYGAWRSRDRVWHCQQGGWAGLDLRVGAAAQGLVRRLDFITGLMRDGGRF